MNNFSDNLLNAIDKKQNPSVVGLDPRFLDIPEFIKNEAKEKQGETFEGIAEAIVIFNKGLIDAVKDIVPAVKPQMAFYEKYGVSGIKAFCRTVKYAKEAGLIVIEDAKRNDIGSTAQAYADGHLGTVESWNGKKEACFNVDCITVNAYLGSDGVKPFVGYAKDGKGIFVLVKTSNPSSGELQDLKTEEGKYNYAVMAENVNKWGQGTEGNRGYISVGAVVGATYPQQADELRNIMNKSIFLVPGYGAQGGGADGVVPCFNSDGYGAIVNSSRGINFAYKKGEWKPEQFSEAAKVAAEAMKEDICGALKRANKLPW